MNDAYPTLIVQRVGPVARVTLNRPERLNALDDALVSDLTRFLRAARDDDALRVIVMRGAGRAFCAGLDLKSAKTGSAAGGISDGLRAQRRIRDIMLEMHRLPQVILAALNGPASGAGMGIALAADLRIATPQGRMNAAFIKLGVSACDMGVSYFLPRMLGTSLAKHYMLTGRFIEPQRALELGLVSAVVEEDALDVEIDALLADLLRATPLGLRLTKDAFDHAVDMPSLESVLALEDRNQILGVQGEDFAEGVRAFLEKREPRYRGA
ncbi:enoyl-CoA hydratase/isomerase family protein [Quisquiliibacterium transsilvanicum]|uniref:Enoyl-CoA hydratase n=1 Tax=Quisquiliibacterium transsilvanicum TaxID=1549638 RepID=A0A7W8HIH9_9BURK|nr:enoyl-CoA hydratase-related protein [Quisquiliibacterium transsilvanicum]MBB5272687.1 enoyl-CoA hydratase [Quisquiliibacterium transsilvanicum]